MSASPADVVGGIVLPDGTIDPVSGDDAARLMVREDHASTVPLAMTDGRQLSAARRRTDAH